MPPEAGGARSEAGAATSEAPAFAGAGSNASLGGAGDARREGPQVQGAEVAATQAEPAGERDSQLANRASDSGTPPDRAE